MRLRLPRLRPPRIRRVSDGTATDIRTAIVLGRLEAIVARLEVLADITSEDVDGEDTD